MQNYVNETEECVCVCVCKREREREIEIERERCNKVIKCVGTMPVCGYQLLLRMVAEGLELPSGHRWQ